MQDRMSLTWLMQHKALLDTNGMLAVWLEQWEQCLGDDFEEAQQLTKLQDKSVQTVEISPTIAAFQVQIRTRPRRPHNFTGDLCAFALGFLLAGSVSATHICMQQPHAELETAGWCKAECSLCPQHSGLLCCMHV